MIEQHQPLLTQGDMARLTRRRRHKLTDFDGLAGVSLGDLLDVEARSKPDWKLSRFVSKTLSVFRERVKGGESSVGSNRYMRRHTNNSMFHIILCILLRYFFYETNPFSVMIWTRGRRHMLADVALLNYLTYASTGS